MTMAMAMIFRVSILCAMLSYSVGDVHPSVDAIVDPTEEPSAYYEENGVCVFDHTLGCICNYSEICTDACKVNTTRTCLWKSEECGYKWAKSPSCHDHEQNLTVEKLVAFISPKMRNCPLEDKAAQDVKAVEVEEDQLYSSERCGVAQTVHHRAHNFVRIGGGRLTTRGEWPWHVSLRFESETQVHCGGTLIGSSWVLTSLHCLYRYRNGEMSENIFNERLLLIISHYDLNMHDGTEVLRRPKAFFTAPYGDNYNDLDFDVVLIQLDEAVSVMPACLPADTYNPDPYSDKMECVAVGFGHTNPSGALCNVLLKVNLFQLSYAHCNLTEDLHRHKICAGSHKKKTNTCNKDSGGGLFCKTRLNKTERWMLLGITRSGLSHDKDCDDSLGVYERVSWYMQWIDAIMKLHN